MKELIVRLNPVQSIDDDTNILSYDVNVIEENNGEKKCERLEQKLNEQLNQQPLNSEDGYVKGCIFKVLYDDGLVNKLESIKFENVVLGSGNKIKSLVVAF